MMDVVCIESAVHKTLNNIFDGVDETYTIATIVLQSHQSGV